MISALTGLGVAVVMSGIAFYKGRTGWHWFALTLFAFASVYLLSMIALFAADLPVTVATDDRSLAGFAGAVTCTVILIVLFAIPPRPKRHSAGLAHASRTPPR
jgi:hypothetical protein